MDKRLAVGSFAWLALTAACMQERPEVGSGSTEILGGTAGSVGQYPTVVAVLNNGLCTGTLISRDLVLTAAHCIHPGVLGYSSQEQVTAGTTVLLDSTSVFQGGRQISASDTIPNPGFSLSQLGDDDIGLIRLNTAVTDREPTPINRIAADAPAGIHVTQVGYGVTDSNDQNSAGTLYVLADKASRTCSQFEGSNELLLCYGQTDGTGKCSGDSGGPSFADINGVQRVVGVTSFGDQNCTTFGADTRVNAETAFLYEHAPELQCQADGICNEVCATGSLPVDPDCPVCEVDGDCGTDQVCVDGRCIAAPFTPGGLGSTCESSDDCDTGLCARDGEESQCTSSCEPAASDCPDGFECLEAGVCWASEGGGGCRATGAGGGALAWIALLGLALVIARRRRAR